ncbi:Cyclic nucleotide-gated ion channel 1 [Morella rubra]|uniref:Cyclic nucleotide-gated ion channel 1 n=1 Tax=Morella rubra TaxID=262757 RepID=A0A6A1UXH9_9ROSI|nr:Cyclic nucleotide-gated ion channel 1 [Morella rubra]
MTERYRTHPHPHPREKQAGVPDVERQSPTSDGAHSGHKRTTPIRIGQVKNWMAPILDPQKKFQRRWKKMFVVSCVIALSVDPLFLYLPVINEDRKCLSLDETLITTVAISLRLVTDLVYVLNIIFQFLCPYIDEVSGELVRTDARRLRNGCFLSYVTVDILAILPIPQVVIPVLLSEIRRSMSLNKRKLLNAVVLFHYIPRASRIRMSWRELKKTKTVFRTIPVKAACNLFLYIVSSHEICRIC